MSGRARLVQFSVICSNHSRFSALFVILSDFLGHLGPSVGIMPGQSDFPESIIVS